ncbi:MAG: DNA gyrase subunit A, partial [Actinomycetota bacterium]
MAKKRYDTPAKTSAGGGKAGRKGGGTGGAGDGNGSSQLPLSSGDSVQPIQLQEEMERSFLDYAISTIMSRALPDVRDGLKPVHRRIIWDMDQQGFRPDRPYVK